MKVVRGAVLAAVMSCVVHGLAAGQQERPGEGIWRNYDFVPGDTVWRVIDWADEPVGRFPQDQVDFIRGNMEIVERDGVRLLEAKSNNSTFEVTLPDTLPEAFTVEFMIEVPTRNIGTYVHFAPASGGIGRNPFHYLYLHGSPGIYFQSDAISNADLVDEVVARSTPVRVQVNGSYAILYVGPHRAGMIPNANIPRADRLQFVLNGNPRFPTYVSDIVVRVGLGSLYDGLMREGSVTTYAFLFDTDSDRLRGESTPKLDELRAMLAEHKDLRIEIIGHTDDTGDEAHNQALSDRRARSVVEWLVASGIAGDRLSAAGRGESEPIADNSDAAGRAKNRRVVIRLAGDA